MTNQGKIAITSQTGQNIAREKGRDLIQSCGKSPNTNRKVQKQSDNTKIPANTSISQRLRTDLGRSFGVRQPPSWCS